MNRVRELRRSAGIKRTEDLAEAVGLSREALSRIETGKSPLTDRHAERIAKVLGCAIGDLFAERSPHEAEAVPIAAALHRQDPAALADWLAIGRRLLPYAS
ncbi:MAG: helix-turn-helix transcriptional regulator [Pseudomonadota bacterium]